MKKRMSHDTLIDRRRILASGLAGLGGISLAVDANAAAPVATVLPPMTSAAEEGPFYLSLNMERSDIAEGRPGIPLEIRFKVIDETGAPYVGALVDVWHCDAQGNYSGMGEAPFGVANHHDQTTFLRGMQKADVNGDVVFQSIYPGWYHGRTTHIHFKIRQGAITHLTSQFFLPDTLSEYLYTEVSEYRRDTLRDTLNSDDGVAIGAGDTVEGAVRESNGRYVVGLTVRVDRSVSAAPELPMRGGGPHGPGGSFEFGPGGHGGPPPGPPPGRMHPGGMPLMRDGFGPPRPEVPLTGERRTTALLPTATRAARRRPPPPPRA